MPRGSSKVATSARHPLASARALARPAGAQHAPGPLTPHAKRQGWLEPRARSWVIVAVALALLAAYLLISQYIVYHGDAWLFQKGVRVDAELTRVESAVTSGQRY